MEITPELFEAQRQPRFGSANPERMNVDFWEWMIRGDENTCTTEEDEEDVVTCGYTPYQARTWFDAVGDYSSPIWTFERMGASRTVLPDGRTVCIGGEHEDYYDPDFCIYNDVVVFSPTGEIEIYGYPKTVFPPTDFHTATLLGDRLIIIGGLGYPDDRQPGSTPVFVLDLADYHISCVQTRGDAPGWICKHESMIDADGMITIRVGEVCDVAAGEQKLRGNFDDFALDPSTGIWKRLTNRTWRQFLIRNEAKKLFIMGERAKVEAILVDAAALLAEKKPDLVQAFPNLHDPFSFVTFEAVVPPELAEGLELGEDCMSARFQVEGVPIALKLVHDAIEVVVEGALEADRTLRFLEEMRERVQAVSGLPCVLKDVT